MTVATTDPRTDAATLTPSPADEQARRRAIARLGLMQRQRGADLDALARLAANVCGAPSAAVNVLDGERQHSLGAFGWEPPDFPQDSAMCAKSILIRDVSYARNAALDERWAGNPFTDGTLAEIKLYAAAPLVLADGEVAGTLCTFSSDEGALNRVQLEMLRDLASLAVRLLELQDTTSRLGAAALRDGLTGLPNRELFGESLQRSLARHARGAASPAVLFLDVNGFKAVNDSYGHAAGDELLRAIAERLLECVRATDLLARWGGDEFVVLCDPIDAEATGLDVVTGRIRQAMGEPFDLTAGRVQVGVSIGVATTADGTTADVLLAAADAAMYDDKRAGRRDHAGR